MRRRIIFGSPEPELRAHFSEITNELDLSDQLSLLPGRETPRNIGEYALAPLVSKRIFLDSYQPTSYFTLPEGVECHYREDADMPLLDTSYGVGLVFRGVLQAVAAAHSVVGSRLRIVQLQAVNRDAADPDKKYHTGLHGGFYWRDTLVQAWLNIGPQVNADGLEILSAQRSKWLETAGLEQLKKSYDEVGKRMRFTYCNGPQVWRQNFEH
jgi:hypothetical protein